MLLMMLAQYSSAVHHCDCITVVGKLSVLASFAVAVSPVASASATA
jgi:hypothetical protein